MKYLTILLLLFSTAVVIADEVVPTDEKTVTVPDVQFPMTPVLVEPLILTPKPVPRPNPASGIITDIPSNSWYILESKTQLYVFDVPSGYTTIKEYDVSTISRSFLGKFVDGNGQSDEERTYPSTKDYKYIYSIRALKKGTVGLVTVPVGVDSKDKITQNMITVMSEAPNPPPDPKPDPDDDNPPTPTTSFRVIFVKESGATLNPEQTAIPAAKAIRDYLNEKTTSENGSVGWKEYDPQMVTTNEPPTMKALWEATKNQITYVPCMIIEVNGHVKILPFPTNADEALITLKSYGGR
jgi:hypothetical protein